MTLTLLRPMFFEFFLFQRVQSSLLVDELFEDFFDFFGFPLEPELEFDFLVQIGVHTCSSARNLLPPLSMWPEKASISISFSIIFAHMR